MVSTLSQVKWQPVAAPVDLFGLAPRRAPEPLSQLVRLTGLPELHGTPRDKLVTLLRMAAEVEHAFIIQYLFGAFSLRLDDPNGKSWYRTLYGIAKEEMGH